jgi:hypothetical protein
LNLMLKVRDLCGKRWPHRCDQPLKVSARASIRNIADTVSASAIPNIVWIGCVFTGGPISFIRFKKSLNQSLQI